MVFLWIDIWRVDFLWPNALDQTFGSLARLVRLGARGVTANRMSVTTGSAPWFLFLAPEIIMRVGSVSFQADSFLSNDGFAPSLPLSGDSVLFFGASYAYNLSLTAFYIRGIRFAERPR
jgi:hypothetical protein